MTTPQVTMQDIEDAIASEHYFTARDGAEGACGGGSTYPVELGLILFCVLVLKNGRTVTGKAEYVGPEHYFDPATVRKAARQEAVERLCPMVSYALSERQNA